MKKILVIIIVYALVMSSCKKENMDPTSRCTVCTDNNGNERDSICGTESQLKSYCGSKGWNVKL